AIAPFELAPLARGDGFDGRVGDAELVDDVAAQHAYAAARDRAHRQLGMTGDAEFPDDEHVERRVERPRHFGADRDAAARQREHDDVGSTFVLPELVSQLTSRVDAITEAHGEAAAFRSLHPANRPRMGPPQGVWDEASSGSRRGTGADAGNRCRAVAGGR